MADHTDHTGCAGSRTDFEVYVHVPFCLRRCGYCDFNTYTAPDLGGGASRGNYANTVIREMELVRAWQEDHGIEEPAASTVFFGGGTPTVLSAADLTAILGAVRRIWGLAPGAEITTEANPDTVDEAYVAELADGGFTRISFGMQSAVPHVLRTLDRTHTPANVEAGVRAADKAGLWSSVDLIYGAPGESLDDWRTSVRTAIDLGVDHISAYALTVEPTTKMGRQIAAGLIPRPDDDDEAAKYEIADELFSEAGLRWYEISNWARPGFESRHNLGYWRNVDWAGLGPGAHSHYNGAGSAGRGLRSWDIAHPRMWGTAIRSGKVPWADDESIDAEADIEEFVMLAVRLREGLALADLVRRLRNDRGMDERVAAGIAGDIARRADDEGLAEVTDGRMIPTLKGRLLNDTLIEEMLEAIDAA
ncbi:radical SAM family heme chaperone HemW [Bifidobacterium simiarum]|uniref:Heme chaperone HemW n=1 Tax=Bifidobacterium simiarum TaxID=2045441 RepID=A0A2M9HD76_9BIFI|nr:radical SAM family heme chaperone HemW [Bifidobacterium simiarum]PJM74747.1 coproporphyrinogen III oxidase [Bifidobacterium simiarum]